MATLTITLPDEMNDFVQKKVREGFDLSRFVESALAGLEKQEWKSAVDQLLLDRLNEPKAPFDPARIEAMTAAIIERNPGSVELPDED